MTNSALYATSFDYSYGRYVSAQAAKNGVEFVAMSASRAITFAGPCQVNSVQPAQGPCQVHKPQGGCGVHRPQGACTVHRPQGACTSHKV